mgnify:CR=1 FL=1
MAKHKDKEAINQAEWEDSDNWSTIYFSKRDSRSSVPKRNPKLGRTINFAHPKGARWIYYLMLLFFSLGLMIGTGLGAGLVLVQ